MHYRNGREAKNGDMVVQLSVDYGEGARITAVGMLFDAKPGNSYCNGSIAPTLGGPVANACLCDCIHADDLSSMLADHGLNTRPPGK